MNQAHRNRKQEIRSFFMREKYSDANLVRLLTHAREGKLQDASCCCFIGITTAPEHIHEGTLADMPRDHIGHYSAAALNVGGMIADGAYATISGVDEVRRRILIPMILAEIKRRSKEEVTSESIHRRSLEVSPPREVQIQSQLSPAR